MAAQRAKDNKKLASKKAGDFDFKSSAQQPIEAMTHLERSLLMAEISMISYLDVGECNVAAGKLGFSNGKFFDRGGSQAYWFQSENDSVVVFRGTEADDWNDIKADADAVAALAETVGKVHRGFKREVDAIWPLIEKELETNTKPIWFCGHSLGGALATICSGRCVLSYLKMEPAGLYTFGSPRVGCKRYVNHVPLRHYRWVNNNDIVTRVPPVLLGYRHSGTEQYLDRHGRLRNITGWRRASDMMKGFFTELTTKFRIDSLGDHSIVDYIETIHDQVRREKSGKIST
jgi:triacylglycerol lipase